MREKILIFKAKSNGLLKFEHFTLLYQKYEQNFTISISIKCVFLIEILRNRSYHILNMKFPWSTSIVDVLKSESKLDDKLEHITKGKIRSQHAPDKDNAY